MRRPLGLIAAAAIALVLASQPTWAQRAQPEHPVFGHSLFSGSGFIATPHAFVPKSTFFATGSAMVADNLGSADSPDGTDTELSTEARAAAGISLAGWIEAGATIHNTDVFAVFGKAQVVRQSGVFPAIAVGVLNGTSANVGRFGVEDLFYDEWWKATTIYGVFSYVVGPGGRGFPSWVVISGGWGNGIFLEDNPQFAGDERSGGVFGSVAFDFRAGEGAYIRVASEWDGFDLHLGATAWLKGLEFTVGVLSIDEGEALEPLQPGEAFDATRTPQGIFYNQTKVFISMTVDFRVFGSLPWIWTSDKEE
jgi:hypothetical protein